VAPDIYIFGLRFPLYALAQCLVMAVCFGLGVRYNHTKGSRYPISLIISIWAAVPGIALGRVLYYILYKCPTQSYSIWDIEYGGNVAAGMILGVFVGVLSYLHLKKIPYLAGIEIFIPYAPLADIFGRLGCFAAGCCYGKCANVPWAVSYPPDSLAYRHHFQMGLIGFDSSKSLPVHPTQLYAVLVAFFIFLFLLWLRSRKPLPGTLLLAFLCLYSGERVAMDFLRDDRPLVFLRMSASQIAAALLFIVALFLLWRLIRKKTALANGLKTVDPSIPD